MTTCDKDGGGVKKSWNSYDVIYGWPLMCMYIWCTYVCVYICVGVCVHSYIFIVIGFYEIFAKWKSLRTDPICLIFSYSILHTVVNYAAYAIVDTILIVNCLFNNHLLINSPLLSTRYLLYKIKLILQHYNILCCTKQYFMHVYFVF